MCATGAAVDGVRVGERVVALTNAGGLAETAVADAALAAGCEAAFVRDGSLAEAVRALLASRPGTATRHRRHDDGLRYWRPVP